jgi:hypothetical protein
VFGFGERRWQGEGETPPPLPWNGKQNPEKNSNFFLFVKFKFDYKSNLKMDYL